MSQYTREQIVGATVGEELVCAECLTEEEWKELTLDTILTEDELTLDTIHFCDRCKEQVQV